MLYVVATPIGNLQDITLRAIKVLKEVDLILAEDTRKSQILTDRYEIKTKKWSFHRFNEWDRHQKVLQLLDEGKKIALIADAGTPTICDPGKNLIWACHDKKIKVVAVPGACAFIAALSLFPIDQPFQFVGFLEKKGKQQLIDILYYQGVTIAYESPHHLMTTLRWIDAIAPNIKIFIAKELTKIHEETLHGTANYLINHFNKGKIRGEYVLFVEGDPSLINEDPATLIRELQERFDLQRKDAIVAAAKLLKISKKSCIKSTIDFLKKR